jgi:hypothetical protein
MTQRLILEISGPRMGSTNLRQHLSAFDRVEALGELFLPDFPLAEDLMADVAEAMAARGLRRPADRAALAEVLRADPIEGIEAALDACVRRGTPHPVLKLGMSHLSAPQMDQLIRHFRPFGMVLHRAPIDQFISREKAVSVRTWFRRDTTGIKPRITPASFRGFRARQENHLRMGLHLLRRHGCPHLVFVYEDLYAQPARVHELLARRFEEAGFDLGAHQGWVSEMPRQDNSPSRAGKVENWDVFLAGMGKGPPVDMERYRIEGSSVLMNAQILAERLLPRSALRGLARRIGISGMPERGAKAGG